MKAAVLTKYGPPEVLQLMNIDIPIPKENDILLKVNAVSVSMGDCEMRSLKLPFFIGILTRLFLGITKPRKQVVLGQEVSGVVEKVGNQVKNYKKGDRVFGHLGFDMGGYAEYVILTKEAVFTKKPDILSDEEAASLPVGGLNALYFLRKAKIQQGKKVLINGAGGSIGTVAVQLAKFYGAHVSAVDSTKKLDMLRSVGADVVIDYTKEDFTKNGKDYDVVLDVVGKASYPGCLRSTNENGYYLVANPKFHHRIRKLWSNLFGKKHVIAEAAKETTEDLQFLAKMTEKGKLKPVVDIIFSLDQISEAHKHVESGQRTRGNVVIQIRS